MFIFIRQESSDLQSEENLKKSPQSIDGILFMITISLNCLEYTPKLIR